MLRALRRFKQDSRLTIQNSQRFMWTTGITYPTYYIENKLYNWGEWTKTPNLYHVYYEEYRQPKSTVKIRAKKTKGAEEPLHGEERHVVD